MAYSDKCAAGNPIRPDTACLKCGAMPSDGCWLAPPKPTDAEIAALRVRVEALEAGLREIEDWAPNWAQGVDENVDAIRDYARALLEGDDAIKDFARALLEQKP